MNFYSTQVQFYNECAKLHYWHSVASSLELEAENGMSSCLPKDGVTM